MAHICITRPQWVKLLVRNKQTSYACCRTSTIARSVMIYLRRGPIYTGPIFEGLWRYAIPQRAYSSEGVYEFKPWPLAKWFSSNGLHIVISNSWWRHQKETFSALLALCAGNSPVPGEFHAQRPVTRSFDVFFDLRLNKWSSKQSWGWWFETPSCPLWRHCNVLNKFRRNVRHAARFCSGVFVELVNVEGYQYYNLLWKVRIYNIAFLYRRVTEVLELYLNLSVAELTQ